MEKTSARKFNFFYVEAKPYEPYPYINSKYREDYPGYKPKMR
jgi:hypothetical protein